eukprot:10006675-Ditylum_brightwellii.AAC.1
MQQQWQYGAHFMFNCYCHWAKLVICQPGQELEVLQSKEGVTQDDPLSMVAYDVTLVPFAEKIRAADDSVVAPFYADDVVLDGMTAQNAKLIKLLVERGSDMDTSPDQRSQFTSATTQQTWKKHGQHLQQKR